MIPLALSTLLATAVAAEAPPDPQTGDLWWGQTQGLMAGITFAHAIQPVLVLTGDLEWSDKHVVSIAGAVLYGTTTGGLLARKRWALKLSIWGPAVGVSSVLGGLALGELGVIEAEVRPDAFQLAGGVLQGMALVRSVQLLRLPEASVAVRADSVAVAWVF